RRPSRGAGARTRARRSDGTCIARAARAMRRTVNFANGLSLTIALHCAACSGDDPHPGRDAEAELPDAGLDAAAREALDASPDASPDAAVDEGLDPALVAD